MERVSRGMHRWYDEKLDVEFTEAGCSRGLTKKTRTLLQATKLWTSCTIHSKPLPSAWLALHWPDDFLHRCRLLEETIVGVWLSFWYPRGW